MNRIKKPQRQAKRPAGLCGRTLVPLLALSLSALVGGAASAALTLQASPAVVYPGQTVTLTAIGGNFFGDSYSFYLAGSNTPFATVGGNISASATYAVPVTQASGPLNFAVKDGVNNQTGTAGVSVGTSINTDTLTINGANSQFAGVTMTAANVGGVATFTIFGDVTLSGAVTVTGSRPVAIISTNDLALASGVTINVSASGTTAGPGGGVSALGGIGGTSANGGAGGSGGGAGGFYDPNFYESGNTGSSGSGGGGGANGLSGGAGDAGVGGAAGGAAGGAGAGGVSGGGGGGGGGGGRYGDNGGTFVYPKGGAGGSGGSAGSSSGSGGSVGGAGGGGTNALVGLMLGGGGAGGAGGGGGQGAGGGGAGQGGGGGTGGDGDNNHGSGGGNGGNGGKGGKGGDGGLGGAGGAGGGAVALEAYGRLTIGGALIANGGAGAAALAGYNGGAGSNGSDGSGGSAGTGANPGGGGGAGSGGVSGQNSNNGNSGGTGGVGATYFVGAGGGGGGGGGVGGYAAAGASGGNGGGGGGGTVLIYGSVVVGTGNLAAAPGANGDGLTFGGKGRILIAKNNSGTFSGIATTTPSYFPGFQAANPFLSSAATTPYLPDLPADGSQHIGAQAFGISGLSANANFGSIISGANGSLAALYRVHVGPASPVNTDFAGYDYVFLVSLSGNPLVNPALGVGKAATSLLVSSADKNPTGGTAALTSLAPNAVYVTTVPAGTTANFNVSFSSNGQTYNLTSTTLNNGDVKYINIARPIASLAGADLVFNGSGQNVTVPNFGNVAPTSEITIELWQNVNAAAGQSTFDLSPDNSSNRINAHIPYSDGTVYWDFGNITNTGRLAYIPSTPITGSWQHFAFVSSQSGANNPSGTGPYMAIYRNGVLEAYKNGASSFKPAASDLLLGGGNFGGSLDEFRVWNIARPAARIAADVNASLLGSELELVAYYKLDEGKGILAYDSTANHYDGALANAPGWAASGAPINTIHVLYGAPHPFTLGVFDPNGLPDTFAVNSFSGKTVISGAAPFLTYTPTATYDGNDSFVYNANNGSGSSNTATVNVNFGVPVASLTGTLQFKELVASAANQNVAFQFRDPSSGAVLFTRTASIPAAGNINLPYVPLQNYTLWIKPELFLAQTVALTTSAGAFVPFTKAFDGGDSNNDNSVDSTDFGVLIGAFNTQASVPGNGYDIHADFNGDGSVDSTDFGILIGNFNMQGAP